MVTMTTAEVSEYLSTSKENVRQLANRGKLTRVGRKGRQMAYPESEVMQLAAAYQNRRVLTDSLE